MTNLEWLFENDQEFREALADYARRYLCKKKMDELGLKRPREMTIEQYLMSEDTNESPEKYKWLRSKWVRSQRCREWDIGPRGNGKTDRLLHRAYLENLQIVCATEADAARLWNRAQTLGMTALMKPISVSSVGGYNKGLVDDIDRVFSLITGLEVIGATATGIVATR